MEAERVRTENVKLLVKKHGYEKLASMIGRGRAQVSQWANNTINSRTKKPTCISSRSCRSIEKILALTPGWFDVPHDEMDEQQVVVIEKSTGTAAFDVLDVKASCGPGYLNRTETIISQLKMPSERALELIGTTNPYGTIKLITATGDSMIPTINAGEQLFVDTGIREYIGQGVYLLLHGGELICKRLSLVGSAIEVSSDNSFYKSWLWKDKPEETIIVGKLIRSMPIQIKTF